MSDVGGRNVPAACWREIVGLVRSVLDGPENERSGQSRSVRGFEVVVVGGGEHDLARMKTEKLRRLQVSLGIGFIFSVDVGADNHVPRDSGVLGHVEQK